MNCSTNPTMWCLCPISPTGRTRSHDMVRRLRPPGMLWMHLLPGLLTRTLVRCGVLAGLLHLNGWTDSAPSTRFLLLVPVAHAVVLGCTLFYARPKSSRRIQCWVSALLRLYQLILLVLLVSALHRLPALHLAHPTGRRNRGDDHHPRCG